MSILESTKFVALSVAQLFPGIDRKTRGGIEPCMGIRSKRKLPISREPTSALTRDSAIQDGCLKARFPEPERMEEHFTPDQEARLAQIATNAGTDAEGLVKKAVLRLLEDEVTLRLMFSAPANCHSGISAA